MDQKQEEEDAWFESTLNPLMAFLQSHLIYPVVMGFILVGQSFVTYSEVMGSALKDVYNGLLIDQNVRNDRSSLFCLPKGNP